MENKQIVWQLPVKQSNKTDSDWVHPRSNFHAFQSEASLCGKYFQDTDFFETDFNPKEHSENMKCKKCLKLLL
jgi:hypothetical protein